MPDYLGPRREALRSKRARALRQRLTGAGAAALAAGVLAVGGIALFGPDEDLDGGDPAPVPTNIGGDSVVSTLIIGTRETGGSAVWLALLAYDTEDATGAVVYIPAHSAVEVPGRGLQGVGDSLSSGGVPLLLVSAENLLGIGIDRYIELSDRDARTFFAATGPIAVDVPEEVRVSAGKDRARLIFDEGLQRIGASFLVELLYTRGLDADDIELGSRHIAFWDGLFEIFAEDPANLASAVRAAGGALVESDAEVGEHAQLLSALAALEPGDRTLTSLPVQQVSVGGSELYAVDPEEVALLMADFISGEPADSEEVKVQVLNGNGVPGIGQEVAERLIGAGFRVVLSDNARRFNYPRTLIITYDSSPAGQAIAERARKLIGVGEVQVSAQQQGIVDLTIVIGKDFLRTR